MEKKPKVSGLIGLLLLGGSIMVPDVVNAEVNRWGNNGLGISYISGQNRASSANYNGRSTVSGDYVSRINGTTRTGDENVGARKVSGVVPSALVLSVVFGDISSRVSNTISSGVSNTLSGIYLAPDRQNYK